MSRVTRVSLKIGTELYTSFVGGTHQWLEGNQT